MSSTGVIGNPLPIEKIVAGAKRFDLTSKNGENLSKFCVIYNRDEFIFELQDLIGNKEIKKPCSNENRAK